MDRDLWAGVDRYVDALVVRPDAALDSVLQASDEAGLPHIHVPPAQGKLLMLLGLAAGADRILEIGTLGGYSTVWLARGLRPGGRLVTLESDPAHARVAQENLARVGLADVVDVRLGPALETLPALAADGWGPLDLAFIDADKVNNSAYVDWCLRLARPGSIIIVDNVVRGGAVIDAGSEDANVQGTRRLYEWVAAEPRLDASVIQMVSSKGYDGFLLAVVLEEPASAD